MTKKQSRRYQVRQIRRILKNADIGHGIRGRKLYRIGWGAGLSRHHIRKGKEINE